MRFALAISALVLAGILLVLGIGQVTFLAGPREITYSHQFDAGGGVARIDAAELSRLPGQANVVVQGADAFIAYGASRDVRAWLAPFAHAEITVDIEPNAAIAQTNRGGSLSWTAVAADDAAAADYAAATEQTLDPGTSTELNLTPPHPYGSDLWLEQRGAMPAQLLTGEAEPATDSEAADAPDEENQSPEVHLVRLPVALNSEQSLLVFVAEPGSDANVSIVWAQDRRTPWAGPLITAGGVSALLGAIFYLLAVDHDRRGLGPQRGRRGPFIGLRNMFRSAVARNSGRRMQYRALPLALGLSCALGVSACTPQYWPEFNTEQQTSEDTGGAGQTAPDADAAISEAPPHIAPVPVTQAQIDRILADVSTLTGIADEHLDESGLAARFTADALRERAANYTIRRAVSDYEVVLPRITDRTLGYQLVQSTEGWPRTIFVVVSSAPERGSEDAAQPTEEPEQAPDTPSLALLMTQQHPHQNFLVSRTITLRGGIAMPEAAPAEEGTALLADDLQSLVLPPHEVGAAYAELLAGGADAPAAALFDSADDSLLARSGAAWVAQSTEVAASAEEQIQYSVTATQSDERIVTLSTGVGGAILATTVLETRTEAPVEGGRWRPVVPKSLGALSGLEGQQERLVSVVAHQLLFFVPNATEGGSVQLLGYTSGLIDAGTE